ncbi:MAG: hypothetical protein FWC91_05435 [Defluviitaleaceae bacterium]|nr:hypothetical protein [Defluviitaleaceae bacterium]
MKKKMFLSTTLLSLLLIAFPTNAFAVVDSQFIDVTAIVVDDREFLQLSDIVEIFGGTIDQNNESHQITFMQNNTQIILTIKRESPEIALIPEPVPDTINSTRLSTGTFIVGQDIPAGRYIVTGEGSGNFFVRNEGRSFVNEILNDGTSTPGVPSVTIDLENNQEIEIRGMRGAFFTPATRTQSTVLTTGRWIVGVDIPAGSFDAFPTHSTESGNFFVRYNDRSLVNEILTGSDRGSTMGVPSVRVNLQAGQEIQISGLSSVTFR